jgi:hypothetical protein
MKVQQFEILISNHKKFNENLHELHDLGFDFYEGKFQLSVLIDELFTNAIEAFYDKDGVEWVDWFIYETNYGTDEHLTAKDADGNRICYDVESLYNYLEKTCKI